MQQVGCMDVYWSLAKQGTWKPVSWSKDLLHLKGLADLSISEPVYSSLELNGHSLLTGPNRGGKSSSLRAVLQQVLFARVFGITSCLESATLPWYTWIHSRIRSLDTPGEYSLFEEDVRSSAKVLAMAETTPHGLVLIDELFHSTNPPDALLCATTFLTKFWPTKHTTSIISTHSFELLKDVPNHDVKLLCCPATEQDSTIHYTYKLEEGVCKVSSVREVLREAGLLVGQDA
jgi:DNA mismatch repair ATPase MutS